MTENDFAYALRDLYDQMSEDLCELDYFLEAIALITDHLQQLGLKSYWSDCNRDQAYQEYLKVCTQVRMAGEFSVRSRKFIKNYRDKLEKKWLEADEAAKKEELKVTESLQTINLLQVPTNGKIV